MIHRVVHPSPADAAEAVAIFIAECLAEQPDIVLGLPTGRTPVAMYDALVRLHQRGRADFSRVTAFNLDEFVGLRADDPGSYRAFMQTQLFDHVNVDPRRIHIPDTAARHPAREAARYESAIAAAGGLDLVILGIGANGHIGFNEPASSLNASTSVVRLKASSRAANAAGFDGKLRDVPTRAISMGIGTIMSARHVILLATGREKAPVVAKALQGPISTRVPASLLQAHPRSVFVLDRAAASKLRRE